MLSDLRSRLFVSYLFLLVVSLTVLTGVLFIFLRSRPAPPQLAWQRLEVMLPAFTRDLAENLRPMQRNGTSFAVIDDFASRNDVRIILASSDDGRAIILYDSADIFSARDQVRLIQAQDYQATRIVPIRRNTEVIFGHFQNPDKGEWMYAGIAQPNTGVRDDRLVLLLAEERPNKSVQSTLIEFGSSFLIPLMQAAMVGGLIAFVLAYLISQSIAQPLQKLARATASVAKGHYTEHVPESGPREVRQVAKSFNQMSAEVRATQQIQRDFLANVSHDLKTPLTSIQGYSQAIIDGAAKDPGHAARIIHDEASRLDRMVTELTDLARLQAGRLSMKIQPLNLSEIVEAIAYRLAVVARDRSIRIDVNTVPLPKIAGDGDRLVQVVTNLISNAIKYTPEGGQVWVSTQLRNDGCELIVKDNGIGIPVQDLPRIFERFYQVDKSRGPERGTGLGLAITKEIIEAHGGIIQIESPGVNQGTTVTIWLPSPQMTTMVNRRVESS